MKWIRLWPDYIINGTTFTELNAEQRGVWFSLLALAGYSPQPGTICIVPTVSYTREQLSAFMKIPIDILNHCIKHLVSEEINKISINPDNTISIINWSKYQSEYERQKPYRGPLTRERNKIHTANSRARKSGAVVEFTFEFWKQILREFEYRCAYCDIAFSENNGPSMDHMTPLIKGGHHVIENIVPACGTCNSSKRDNTVEEFLPDKSIGLRERQRKLQSKLQPKTIDSASDSASVSVSVSCSYLFNKGLTEKTWEEFKEHRRAMKAELTENAERRLLKKLENMVINGEDPEEVVGRSIENGWKGLFPKNERGNHGTAKRRKSGAQILADGTKDAWD